MSPVIRPGHLPPVEAVRVRVLSLNIVQRVDEEVGPPPAALARDREASGMNLDVVVPVVDVGPVVAVDGNLGLKVLSASAGKFGSVGGVAVLDPPVAVACYQGERGVGRCAGIVRWNGVGFGRRDG